METDIGVAAQPDMNGVAPGSDAAPEAASIPESAAPEVDIWAALENVDPEELFQRNPRLKQHFDGQVGRHAQRQAQALAQQQLEQQRAALIAEAQFAAQKSVEDAELARLRETDLITWDQREAEVRRRRQQEEQQRLVQNAPAIAAFRNMMEYDERVMKPLFAQMPPEAQQRLAMKQYPGDGYESRRLAIEEMAYEIAAGRVSETQSSLTKAHAAEIAAIREAARKDTLSETNGNESIDTGSGMATSGTPTPEEWASIGHARRMQMKRVNPAIETQIEQAASARGEGTSWEDVRRFARGG